VLLGYAAGRHDILSDGSSPYLKQEKPTNTLASVEPPSPYTEKVGECGQVSCGLSLFGGFLAVLTDYWEVLLSQLATANLTRFPRIQVFCLSSRN
jgi:hypothetical protein